MKTFFLLIAFFFLHGILASPHGVARDNTFEKTFGGPLPDYGHALAATSDGGLMVTGLTLSYGDTLGDIYLIKTDAGGKEQWFKIISGPKLEGGNSIVQTADGGYFITCHTESYGAGDCDSWAVKTDSTCTIQWSRTFGGPYDDVGEQGIQTSDGNYVVTGVNRTYDPGGNIFIVKYNQTGDTLWTSIIRSIPSEVGMRVAETSDGDYVVAGFNTTASLTVQDITVLKISNDGIIRWIKNFGGSGTDEAYGLVTTADGGIIVAGSTTGFGSGNADAYLFKMDGNGNQLWSRNYGGLRDDGASSVALTPDGGFILTGYTRSFADSVGIFLIKTDEYGNEQWMKVFADHDYLQSADCIVRCADGGYALTGYKQKIGSADIDLLLLKTDRDGNMSTGVNEIAARVSGLILYPDPAEHFISLLCDSPAKETDIRIYDAVGNMRLEKKNEWNIDVSSLPAGLYYLILRQEQRVLSQKFVRN